MRPTSAAILALIAAALVAVGPVSARTAPGDAGAASGAAAAAPGDPVANAARRCPSGKIDNGRRQCVSRASFFDGKYVKDNLSATVSKGGTKVKLTYVFPARESCPAKTVTSAVVSIGKPINSNGFVGSFTRSAIAAASGRSGFKYQIGISYGSQGDITPCSNGRARAFGIIFKRR